MGIQLKSSPRNNRHPQIEEIPFDFAIHSIELINEIPELNSEPLYDLTKENCSKIRELIDIPFVSFGGIEKYSTLEEKAAVILCATIRGHKFGNGNKRTAVMLFLAMLYVNRKWTTLSWKKLYDLAMKTAKDTKKDFETQIEEITKTLSGKIIERA